MAGLPVSVRPAKPAPYGLVTSETLVTSSDAHWMQGVQLDRSRCSRYATTYASCDVELRGASYGSLPGSGSPTVNPLSIPIGMSATDTCTTTFGRDVQYAQRVAKDALEACTSKLLERELWAGDIALQDDGSSFPTFASLDASVDYLNSAGSPVKPSQGFAMLERAIGNAGCGEVGAVHMTRDVASILALHVKQEGAVLRSVLGNLVVAGTGYTGTTPTDLTPAADEAWMYATAVPSVYLGDIVVDDQPTRLVDGPDQITTTNTLIILAERLGVVLWDTCFIAAVKVDLSLE